MSGRFAWATAMKISINVARYSLNMQYRIYLCISQPPILEPKKVFLINFLEKLSFILEFSFRYTMVTQKIRPELFLSQFFTHV